METIVSQKCRRCNGVLEHDEKRDCMFCPACYPPNRNQKAPVKGERKPDPDLAILEDKIKKIIKQVVPDMIQEELENWYIQKPPVTKKETVNFTESLQQYDESGEVTSSVVTINPPITKSESNPLPAYKPPTWRQQAKELGISLFDTERRCPRKKVDVLKDIEARTSGPEQVLGEPQRPVE